MRQLAAALAAAGIGLAATGCAVMTNGSPVLAGHSGPLAAPLVAVEALDRSLLTTAEVNTVMAVEPTLGICGNPGWNTRTVFGFAVSELPVSALYQV